MIAIAVIAALCLAFANGANDNAKGVATLVGGRTMELKPALILAAAATMAGSIAAVILAAGLVDRFSGKGLVDASVAGTAPFAASVGTAAAVTVLLATRIGMPISTTHALVGAIAGVGLSAGKLFWPALLQAFVIPLLVAPVLALAVAGAGYAGLHRVRLWMGVTRHTCVCIGREVQPVRLDAGGNVVALSSGLKISGADAPQCLERYAGHVVGLDAQRTMDRLHIATASAISFARGLNDTPKIAALMIAAGGLGVGGVMGLVGLMIAVGGLLAARRVARTMASDITEMNDGQAFAANLTTAVLVIFASRFSVPVSTTHVSCGSLFGIGLANGQARGRAVLQIASAWVTTLPLAGVLGWLAWRLLAD